MAALDLNSSDFEELEDELAFHDPYKPSAKIGQQIRDKIIENQAIHRPLSKKSARELEYGTGAPSTRAAQQSVMVAWHAFCSTVKHEYYFSILGHRPKFDARG